ncbi:MAG: hypothetical protein ACJASL_002346 [Paraglaciecola sp.]|jgi:hypothetical protein
MFNVVTVKETIIERSLQDTIESIALYSETETPKRDKLSHNGASMTSVSEYV